jgi:membrane fusion protein (multidrug efflux system)
MQELETPVQTDGAVDGKKYEIRREAPHNVPPKKINKLLLGLVVFAALSSFGTYLGWNAWHYESTDDAFIDGHVIPVSPKISGQVLKVFVSDNQRINSGDPLVQIDPADYKAKLDEEQAKLALAEAELKKASADVGRYRTLINENGISHQQMDQAVANEAKARAEVAKSQASVNLAELNLGYTSINAPTSGIITRKSMEEGMYVQTGQPVLSIVPVLVWVTANFKETQLTHIAPGQPVKIRVDAYPQVELHGHVESIQSGTGERFSVMPPENATGNFVKVVQRVPVKIAIDDPEKSPGKLAPGMSAEPVIRIR